MAQHPGAAWPEPSAGVGQHVEDVEVPEHRWTSARTGREHVDPGAALCPVCGRRTAYTAASGIRRHADRRPLEAR